MITGVSNETGYLFRDCYPEREAIYARFDEASDRARQSPLFKGSLSYGRHPRENLDLFLASSRTAPLVVFFHGGYWQSRDRRHYAFVGERLAREGMHVALPSYPLCPSVNMGTLLASARQSLNAIAVAIHKADLSPLVWILSGHSAGGHIAAQMATTAEPPTPETAVHCLPISGIFDLAPLCDTSLNDALKLTDAQVTAFSPLHQAAGTGNWHLFVGQQETHAFMEQSRNMLQMLTAQGREAEITELPDRNHYSILEDLLDARSRLVPAYCRLADSR